MAVLITCKSDEDLIKNEIAIVQKTFSKIYGASRTTLMLIVETGPKSNLTEILCLSSFGVDSIKIEVAIVRQTFSSLNMYETF